MTKLLTKNTKISNSGDTSYTVYNFGIPAYQSTTGLKTCPMAGKCKIGCYAQSGAYKFSNVAKAFENRLQVTLSTDFIDKMQLELNTKIKTAKRQQKQLVIRIHDSGDFYNYKYLDKWLKIIQNNPDVIFYAYTKMVPLFKRYNKNNKIPSNFTVIYSEGGLADAQIMPNDRHSRVFESIEQLKQANYTDTTKDDKQAFLSPTGKIGLVFHGFASKKWSTN